MYKGSSLDTWRIQVKDSDGAAVETQTKTATFNTQAVNPKGATRIGLYVDVGAKSGTTPTLDVTFQMSVDQGSEWVAMPAAANSQTQAAMTQVTTDGIAYEFYECAIPEAYGRVRAVFTIGGTSPTFTFGDVYWVCVKGV